MNAVIQLLYNIEKFKEEIILSKYNSKNNFLNNLINIFLDLKNNKEEYINPINFINNYKSNIIDIHEQNDTYEFLIDIFVKLEEDLKKSNNKDLIKNYYEINLNIQYSFM
jgi:ubiquitin C-terminal hydrolase